MSVSPLQTMQRKSDGRTMVTIRDVNVHEESAERKPKQVGRMVVASILCHYALFEFDGTYIYFNIIMRIRWMMI